MSIDTNAQTIADYARQSNDVAVQKITLSLLQNGSILDDLPLTTNESLKMTGSRVRGSGLPTVNWGRINKAPASVKAKTERYEEEVALIREIIPIDRRLLSQKNWIEDPIQVQLNALMEAHTYELNTTFFLNDPADPTNGNEDAWVGLRTRLDNPTLYGVESAMKINAGAVDMTTAMTAATANTFLEIVGQMLAYMGSDDGNGVVFYCNWLLKERWARAIRIAGSGGGFTITKDAFDRQVTAFRAAKVRNIGFKADQSSLIISNTEASDGTDPGNDHYTSLYACRYGEGRMKGWQTNALKPENLGRSTETGIMQNVLIDWGCGLWVPHSRAICRAYGIKVS
jgi:hypothetical protein